MVIKFHHFIDFEPYYRGYTSKTANNNIDKMKLLELK